MSTTLTADARTILSPSAVLDTPSMLVDEKLMEQNISEMQALANSFGAQLRPHIKTHKTPQIALRQIAAGARGITCAKLGEAEVMADGGITDILMAYPVVTDLKIKRLLALMERIRMIIAVDSIEAAEGLSSAMTRNERTLEIYIEVNTGANRAGQLAGDDAVKLALDIARLPGLQVIGIMTHEGQANSFPLIKCQSWRGRQASDWSPRPKQSGRQGWRSLKSAAVPRLHPCTPPRSAELPKCDRARTYFGIQPASCTDITDPIGAPPAYWLR